MKLPSSTHREDRAPSKLRGRETEQNVEITVVWRMEIPKFRHSIVNHRRVHVDRASTSLEVWEKMTV